MTKRVLVLGTSHSESSAKRTPDGPIERMETGRWHDYLKTELSCEVTKLARSGVTPEQQFMALQAYFEDCDDTWDLAIVEGRGPETTVSIPEITHKENAIIDKNSSIYERWLDSTGKKEWMPIRATSPSNTSYDKLDGEYDSWLVNYMFSDLHFQNVFAMNYAICNLLKTRCNTVKWFTLNVSKSAMKDFGNNPDIYRWKYGKDLLKDFMLNESFWPYLPIGEIPTEYQFYCGHLDERGHQMLWNEYIKPNVEEYCK